MGAIPSRWVTEVTRDFDNDNEVIVSVSCSASLRPVPASECQWVPLRDLSRQELRRAAANLRLGMPKASTNDDLVAAIKNAVLGGHVPAPPVPSPAPEPEPTIYDGRHKDFGKVLSRIKAGITPWLHGEAGTGKTTLAIQIAEALELPFYGKSVTAQMTEVSFFGYTDANGQVVRTPFREAWENGGVFLLDEASSATPNLAAGINMALANGKVAFPDRMIDRHDDCIIIAAANDTGQGPTPKYPKGIKQDASFLDRFVMTELVLDQRVVDAAVKDRITDPVMRAEWLRLWKKARQNVLKYGLTNVVITPRSAMDGATLRSIGESLRDAAVDTILKGDTGPTAHKVLEGTGVTL